MKKSSQALLLILFFALVIALNAVIIVPQVSAAGAFKLNAKTAPVSDPLSDYSSFVKIKFDKFNTIIDSFFKTVRKNYFDNYDNYRQLMDIIKNDSSYYIDRA
jgi:hypothetical protein